jgi:hypothetical protein
MHFLGQAGGPSYGGSFSGNEAKNYLYRGVKTKSRLESQSSA